VIAGRSVAFQHLPTKRVVRVETVRGLRHCLASPYWEELPGGD